MKHFSRYTGFALLLALGCTVGGVSGGTSDSATSLDASNPRADSGAVVDSGGSQSDSGSSEDASGSMDSAVVSDGGGRRDSGMMADAGMPMDAGGMMQDAGGGGTFRPLPVNGVFDYQLGGAYAPDSRVTIVSRDRTAAPAAGLYNICYVNGFQVQPGEEAMWSGLLLGGNNPVLDPDWDEYIVDVSTPEKRTRVAAIVGAWIRQCADDGYDAVEIDNLDTYTRFGMGLSEETNVTMMRMFADIAHAAGLAIAQKNSAEIVDRRADMGTDFVVIEQCAEYDECSTFINAYPHAAVMIEYPAERGGSTTHFTRSCSMLGAEYPIVLRDVQVRPRGQNNYLFQLCPGR